MSSAFKKNAGIGCIPGKSFGFRFRFGTDRLRRPALVKPEFRGPSNCSWPLSSARNDGDSQIFNNHRCSSNDQVGKQIEYSKRVPAIAAKMRVSIANRARIILLAAKGGLSCLLSVDAGYRDATSELGQQRT
jgi:hypothetical protein